MTILISGATGLVGRALAGSLHRSGVAVSALSRDAAAAARQLPFLRDAYEWRGDPPVLEELGGQESVVHLAGESVVGRWTPAKKRRIRESRILGTRALVDAIEKAQPRPRVLVSASAVGYYGSTGEETVTESSPAGTDFLARVCVDWEREARRVESLGVRLVCLRIGFVLGRAGGALAALERLTAVGLGGAVGHGQQWWSWVHVEDVVGMIRWALEREDLRGPVNAVAPHPERQSDFARALRRAMHRPSILPSPAFALRMTLGEFAQELLTSRRVLPDAALERGYDFLHPQLPSALADLYDA